MSADRLLVVGGGPAGVTAALQARELGAQVTLLEAGQVGGTSLNRGPAPVRTLARAARLARDWSSWATFGLDGPRPVPDLPAVVANSERVARYAHDRKDLAGHLRTLVTSPLRYSAMLAAWPRNGELRLWDRSDRRRRAT